MRRFFVVALGLALLGPTLPSAAAQLDWPTYEPDAWTGVPGAEADPKIDEVVSPLATMPAILEEGDQLTVEVDASRVGPQATPADVQAELVPSFGAAGEPVPLDRVSVSTGEDSRLWPDRSVAKLTFSVPSLADEPRLVEGLHDVRASWPGGEDVQPRAVELVESFPDEPEIVVVADPSVGDPRPVQEAAGDLQNHQDAESATRKTVTTVGVPTMHEGRWGALQQTILEVNLLDPDLVILTGDLTFGIYPRLLPHEYEDAYEVVNDFQAPTFATPGNHDLYTFDPMDTPNAWDGHELWPAYFGPWHYSVDLPGELHMVSINTFDWDQFGRIPFQPPDGETRSGGQVQAEQLAWLAEDLTSFRSEHPDGHIVTFAHHDPSWHQARHPWPGDNRLELRDLLNETGVAAHFSGHKHNDRVARYHEGNVVETIGQAGGPERQLHYVLRDDSIATGFTQDELGEILRQPRHGTAFFTTTTAASGLKGPDWGQGGYWGYRHGTLDWTDGGIDPADLGYPATRAFLDEHAERPDRWNADHSQYGLFSQPSFHIDRALEGPNDGTRSSVTVHLSNDLAVRADLTVPISVRAEDPDEVTVTGGEVVQARSDGHQTDLWVNLELPPDAEQAVQAEADLGLVPTG